MATSSQFQTMTPSGTLPSSRKQAAGSQRGSTQTLPRQKQISAEDGQQLQAHQTLPRQRLLSAGDGVQQQVVSQMVQELKKENFDLKLRLYMTQKNSETAEGRASEYEGQLSALLQRLEEQQRLAEQMEAELKEARMKEKTLITRQKRLELQCAEQTETIHNLSVNLSKLSSSSMQNLNAPKHSTPVRNARSMYINADDSALQDSDEDDDDMQPLPNVSTVAPMPRAQTSTSSYAGESANDSLISRDRGVHTSTSSYGKYSTTVPVNKHNYYNTSVTDNRQNRSEGDNVGIVRPNNTRTVVDINYGDTSEVPLEEAQKKKKKKGLGRLFGLCSGKSGQALSSRDSMYRKRDRPQVIVKTYSE